MGKGIQGLGSLCNGSFLKQGVSCMGVLCIMIYIGGSKENFKSHLCCKNSFFLPWRSKLFLF